MILSKFVLASFLVFPTLVKLIGNRLKVANTKNDFLMNRCYWTVWSAINDKLDEQV